MIQLAELRWKKSAIHAETILLFVHCLKAASHLSRPPQNILANSSPGMSGTGTSASRSTRSTSQNHSQRGSGFSSTVGRWRSSSRSLAGNIAAQWLLCNSSTSWCLVLLITCIGLDSLWFLFHSTSLRSSSPAPAAGSQSPTSEENIFSFDVLHRRKLKKAR
jgi:hypothetical protein